VSWHASRASSVALAVALGCAANSLGAMPEGVNPAAQEIYPFEHFPQRHQVVVICRFEEGNIREVGHAGRRKPRVPAPPYGSHVSRDERAGGILLGSRNQEPEPAQSTSQAASPTRHPPGMVRLELAADATSDHPPISHCARRIQLSRSS